MKSQPPSRRTLRDKKSGFHGRRGKRRYTGTEVLEPGDKTRMIAAPAAAKTQIPISECAGKRDLPDIGKRRADAGRRRRLDKRERARDLAGLVVKPFLFVFFHRPPAA